MANNGIRQLGEPRINVFADRQRPEPFHLEVNDWEYTHNLLYRQCVQRNVVNELVHVLKTPVGQGGCGQGGCGQGGCGQGGCGQGGCGQGGCGLKNVAINSLDH